MRSSTRCLTAAALLFSLPLVQGADFLAGLKKVSKNPDVLAKAVSQGVAKAVPTDVADKIKDGTDKIPGGAVKDAADTLKDSAEQAIQDIESSGVVDDLGEVVEKVPQTLDAAQSATPDEIAATLRESTPQVASALNRTSQHVAEVVGAQSPKLAAGLNKAGQKMADRLDGGKRTEPTWLPSQEEMVAVFARARRASDWLLALVVVGVLSVAGGFAVCQRHKNAERSASESGPALLSDVLEGRSSSNRRPAREPAIQAEAQMSTSLFQKF